jgi:hypothetical protein
MIIKEFYITRKDGVNLYRTYSDEGLYIVQNETGIEYTEAVDVEGAPFTYNETNRLIDSEAENTGDEITGEEFLEMIKEVL